MIAFPKALAQTKDVPTIPPRARKREERKLIAEHGHSAGLILSYVERHDAFLLILPYEGGYTSGVLNPRVAIDHTDLILRKLRRPEDVPEVAHVVRQATWQADHKISRLEGELQTLRWRIMHLEREAAERRPAYSDRTALAVREESAA